MKFHLDEFQRACEYEHTHAFEHLDEAQIRLIKRRGRELHRWYKAHPAFHISISISVIVAIFTIDWLGWIGLSRWIVAAHPGTAARVFAALFVGVSHSWLLYTLAVYSLHEGAAHNLIFPGRGPLSRAASFVSANLGRLATAEPQPYSGNHMAHHARFGTERDTEFLSFVLPSRFWSTLLPLGSFFNYSDFFVHRSTAYTRSSAISGAVAAVYNGLYLFLLYRLFGALFAVIVALLLPHVGFFLDRLRQYSEHNLMPLENNSGSRSFGVGFWGLFVGGGPWGQPCHMAHHMVAGIPWYQQILLHRTMVGIMSPRQREQFLLKPVVGFPLLMWSLMRETNRVSGGPASRLVSDQGSSR
jgi:hypothetical protein